MMKGACQLRARPGHWEGPCQHKCVHAQQSTSTNIHRAARTQPTAAPRAPPALCAPAAAAACCRPAANITSSAGGH
eukprot:276078-Chlamydomonas_euryale.AAC.5